MVTIELETIEAKNFLKWVERAKGVFPHMDILTHRVFKKLTCACAEAKDDPVPGPEIVPVPEPMPEVHSTDGKKGTRRRRG